VLIVLLWDCRLDWMAGTRPAGEADQVKAMFGRIARRYDLANTILSFGRDGSWRRRAARATGLVPGQSALDVACGTGRMTAELARLVLPGGSVVGGDFSREMLQTAARDHPGIDWREVDALALPFAEGSFDAATMAFGLRNLSDRAQGAREMARVVRPGGGLVILEFVKPPTTTAGRVYRTYLERALPTIGGWISGEPAAYGYLSTSIDAFLSAAQLIALARDSGWIDVEIQRLNLGTVAVLRGHRPD
jgi:demethylmenaquinone methyltransferase/2-methoxy-6-polyprenyl-1,4-benzoquinol methylase